MKINKVLVDDIPTACGDCILLYYHDGTYYCPVVDGIKGSQEVCNPVNAEYRRSDCPLEKVKHGHCIFADTEMFTAAGEDGYEIRFRTPSKEKFLAVQAECRRQIDGKENKDGRDE